MTRSGFRKGEYEKAMRKAKDLIEKGVGMAEIQDLTNLTIEDVQKIQKKQGKEYNDPLF